MNKFRAPFLLILILLSSAFGTFASARWVYDLHSPTTAGDLARAAQSHHGIDSHQVGRLGGKYAPYGLLGLCTVLLVWSARLTTKTVIVLYKNR